MLPAMTSLHARLALLALAMARWRAVLQLQVMGGKVVVVQCRMCRGVRRRLRRRQQCVR